MRKLALFVLFTGICLLISVESLRAENSVQAVLLKGVKKIDVGGAIGGLAVFSKSAEVIVTGKKKDAHLPIFATSTIGNGKIIAFAHPGCLTHSTFKTPSMKAFLGNVNSWMTQGSDSKEIAYSAKTKIKRVLKEFYPKAAKARKIQAISKKALKGIDVLYYRSEGDETDAQLKLMVEFVENGGCIAIAFAGWIWKRYWSKEGDLVTECPVNKFLADAGIAYSSEIIDAIDSVGDCKKFASVCHAYHSLEKVIAMKEIKKKKREDISNRKQLCRIVENAVRCVPVGDQLLLPRIRQVIPQGYFPSRRTPATFYAPLKRLAVVLYDRDSKYLPEVAKTPALGVDIFPMVPEYKIESVPQKFRIDTSIPGWASTGLYVPPATTVEVILSAKKFPEGYYIRVGANKDLVWGRDSWYRYPDISRRFKLEKKVTKVISPFGGLLYIEVPKGQTRILTFKVKNALKAPYYVLGETSKSEWLYARHYPSPWAELATSRVILTLPSALIRELGDPKDLMKKWHEILGWYSELDTCELRTRPERMVVDVQISVGYMHSGYPIMMQTFNRADADLVNIEKIISNPEKCWGLWHEIGHNHQKKAWTFKGATEVTVNIFTLYVIEKMTGKPTKLEGNYLKWFEEYMSKKCTISDWGNVPKKALCMYVQLIERFGWKSFQRVFAEYRQLKEKDLPKTDNEKRDQWLIRMSRTVGKDLSAFFKKYGVPVSLAAKREISNLPKWLPDNLK